MNAPPDITPVLVVLVNNQADWQRVRDEHWYRIPLKHAPPLVAASFLAFYQTRYAGSDAWSIRFYAPILRFRQVARRILLPDEPNHPRGDDLYFQIDLEALRELPRPIPARKLRRITFIPTTWARLVAAEEINDLWLHDAAEDVVRTWFRHAAIKARRRLEIGEGGDKNTRPP